jgi:hypothetical protein
MWLEFLSPLWSSPNCILLTILREENMKRLLISTVLILVVSNFANAVGTWTTLDNPAATSTEVQGISGSKILARCMAAGRDFIYDGTSWTAMNYGRYFDSWACGIDGNNVVGEYGHYYENQGFICNGQDYLLLNYPGALYTQAFGINGNLIVGYYADKSYAGHAFVYDGTNWSTLNFPPGAIPMDIDANNIIGLYKDEHGFLYDGTSWSTLDFPGASITRPLGISGTQVVGWYYDANSNCSGFLFDGASWKTLDYPGAVLTCASGIDGDTIVGFYRDTSNTTHGFIYKMPILFAEAGPDQTVYTYADNKAEVKLDGSDSNDPHGLELSYKWKWVIDANVYEANGINPIVELPIGVHTIQLIVNNGLSDSQPDDVNVTIIGSLEGKLKIMPQRINRNSNQTRIQAVIELPNGIGKEDIDSNERFALYCSDDLSHPMFSQQANWENGRIMASFAKDELVATISTNGNAELTVVGKLKSGQYFYGADTIKILH